MALQISREIAVRPELWKELIELYEIGYLIVIDDFLIRPDSLPLLEIAGMVKFDMNRLSPQHLRVQTAALSGYPVKTIASGIKSYAVFEDCTQAEIDLFQGDFVLTPRHVARNAAGSHHFGRLRLIARFRIPGSSWNSWTTSSRPICASATGCCD